ncbi:MAG: DNA polymerase III subunit beta [Planctomycetota bacterium]
MRFSCPRSSLAEVATVVGQAVAGKSTKKIFECLRITAKDGALEIAGTDLEVAVRHRITEHVQVDEDGIAVVPAALFAGLLREIADEQLTVAVAKQKLTLDTDGGRFELECEDATQYPEIPTFPAESTGKVEPADLKALVRKTAFATGKEAARFVLNGVRVAAEEDALRFVGCDGRRLAILARPLERTGGGGDAAIVGVKGLQHFERAAATAEEPVEIAIADRFVAVRTPKVEVVARVLEGTFPDYEQIVPKGAGHTASVPVTLFGSRLRQVGQFTGVQSQAVIIQFAPGELSLSAAGSDGRADVRLAVEYDGPEEKIGFNPAFLLDSLKVVDGEAIRLTVSGRNAAAKLEDDNGFLYVVMPVLID